MLNEIITIFVAATVVSFVSTKCCIYTAILSYSILSTLGMSPLYCVGYVKDVDGDNWYHAWVRVGSHDIEQSTLNLCHYDLVDYGDPLITFNSTPDFVNRVDLWSPFRGIL